MNLEDYSVCLYNNVPDRQSLPPQPGTLGGIVFGDDLNANEYDIVVHSRDGYPQRVSKMHPSYMPLQYPLLFPYGEDGWNLSMRLTINEIRSSKSLTANMYYSFLIHDRRDKKSILLKGGRLFQQFLVDAYVCIEEGRLDYIRNNQDKF